MTYRTAIVLILAVAAASCSPGRRSSPPTNQPDSDTANRPALTQPQSDYQDLSSRSYMLEAGAGSAAPVPPMEAGREVNTQDCTKEINTAAGNLKCQ